MPDGWPKCGACGEREAVMTVVWADADSRLALVAGARQLASGRWLVELDRECERRLREEWERER